MPARRAADISSQTVKSSSSPTCGGSAAALNRRASSIITATAVLLSAPRIPSPRWSSRRRRAPDRPARSAGRCPCARTGEWTWTRPPGAGDAGQQVSRARADARTDIVLLDIESHALELPGDPVRARALTAGRALDPAQGGERLVQALAFRLGRAPHRVPRSRPAARPTVTWRRRRGRPDRGPRRLPPRHQSALARHPRTRGTAAPGARDAT